MKKNFKKSAKSLSQKNAALASMSTCSLLGLLLGLMVFLLLSDRKMCDAGLKEISKLNCTTNDTNHCHDDVDAFEFNCSTQSNNQTVVNAINYAGDMLYLSALGGGIGTGLVIGFLMFLCVVFLSQKENRKEVIELSYEENSQIMFKGFALNSDKDETRPLLEQKK